MRNIERVLRKGFLWVLLFSCLVTAAVGVYLYRFVPDTYAAKAALMVTLRTGNGGTQVYENDAYNLFAHDCKTLIRYSWLREDAEAMLSNGQTLEGITFDASGEKDSQLLYVHARGTDPTQAADAANAMAQVFGPYVSTLSQVDEISVSQDAEPPKEPSGPNRIQTIIMTFLVCMLVGASLCVVIGLLRRRIHSGDPVEAQFGVPVLGSVQGFDAEYKRYLHSDMQRPLLDVVSRSVHEQLGALAVSLQVAAKKNDWHSLTITSSCASEGKSSLTVLLGSLLARQGWRVLLVDMDAYAPSLHKLLGVRGEKDLLDCLEGRATLAEATVSTQVDGVCLIDNRNHRSATVSLMSSGEAVALRQQMLEHFDYVLYDTPPVGVFADAMAVGHAQDATLLALANGRVKKRQFVRAVDRLQKSEAHLIGLVFTYARANRVDYAHMYEDYEEQAEQAKEAPKARKRRRQTLSH